MRHRLCRLSPPAALSTTVAAVFAAAVALMVAVQPAAAQRAPDKVRIGVLLSVTDVMLYMADSYGYFKEVGIEPEFVTLKSGTEMVAPLTSGELAVAAGGPTAGLYNAYKRGIAVKIVADKGVMTGSLGHMPMLVAKALADKSAVKSLADLKGLRVAMTGLGGPAEARVFMMLQKAGLTFKDITAVYLSPPQMAAAFQNGAIDTALILEPAATLTIRRGAAVHFDYGKDFYPNQQTAVVLYGPGILKSRDLAERFMVAYVRASRDYNDSVVDGRVQGRGADKVIDTWIASTPIKNRDVLKAIRAHGMDPNGAVNVDSLKRDLAALKQLGRVKTDVSVDDLVDQSYAQAAAKKLGPYVRRSK